MSGTIIGVSAMGGSSPARGTLLPAHGGPPLAFEVADTEDGQDGGVLTLAASHVGSACTYTYDGGSGLAKKVRV